MRFCGEFSHENFQTVSLNFSLNGCCPSSMARDTCPLLCYVRVTSEIVRRIMGGNFIGHLIKRGEKKKYAYSRSCVTRTSHGVNTSAAADTPLSGVWHAFPHYQSIPGARPPLSSTLPQLTPARSVSHPSCRNSPSAEHGTNERKIAHAGVSDR